MIYEEPQDSIHMHRSRATQLHEKDHGQRFCDFETSTFFTNESGDDVTVISRANVPLTIEHKANGFTRQQLFTVRSVLSFKTNARIINTINLLQQQKQDGRTLGEEQSIILDTLQSSIKYNCNVSHVQVVIDWRYSTEELKKSGSLYCPASDMLLLFGANNVSKIHPYSPEGMSEASYLHQCNYNPKTGFHIEVVDNERHRDVRFIYIAKEVIQISSTIDPSKENGVYVTRAENVDGQLVIDPKFYTFAEAKECIGLHDTRDEALTYGNPEIINSQLLKRAEGDLFSLKQSYETVKEQARINDVRRTQEIERLTHDHQIELQEFKTQTLKFERWLEESKQLLEQQRQENERLKYQLENRKVVRNDHYEQRSAERKDASELMKYIPSLAFGLIAGVGLAFSRSER